MGKRFLLSAIAVSVIAGVANAGTLGDFNTSMKMDKETASTEYLNQVDLNNSHKAEMSIPLNGYYKPTTIKLNSLKNPVLSVTFSHVKKGLTSAVSVNKKIIMCEVDSAGKPKGADDAGTPFLKFKDTTSDGFSMIAYNSDVYMTNNKVYKLYIDDDNNCTNGVVRDVNISGNDINVTFDAGELAKSSGVDVTFKLGTGDSQEVHDTASANVVAVGTEVCCYVDTNKNLNAKIDPKKDFLEFVAQSCGNEALTSTLQIDCKEVGVNGGVPNYSMGKTNVELVVSSNEALPLDAENGISAKDFAGTSVAKENITNTDNKTFKIVEKDQTITTTYNNIRSTSVTFKVDGKTKIPVANFKVSLGLDLDKDGKVDGYKLQDAKAGSWTYNGSTLQTPYISANSDTQTILRINNNSSLNANVYWTCYDDEGNVVSMLQVNKYKGDNAKIPAHSSADWLGSELLKAMRNVNPDFASNNKMKCSAIVTDDGNANGLEIMTINGARDRVIPFD